MFDKLDAAENRYEELSMKLSDPRVIADQDEYRKLMKEFSGLEEIVLKYREYKKAKKDMAEAKELLEESADRELRELAQGELDEAKARLGTIENELKQLLMPKDPNDNRNVIVEIRGGAGGEEAALFAADLFRMYTRYCERHQWRSEILDIHETEIGGIKEVIFSVEPARARYRGRREDPHVDSHGGGPSRSG